MNWPKVGQLRDGLLLILQKEPMELVRSLLSARDSTIRLVGEADMGGSVEVWGSGLAKPLLSLLHLGLRRRNRRQALVFLVALSVVPGRVQSPILSRPWESLLSF